MTTRAIRTEQDRRDAIRLLERRELPCTLEIHKGLPRSPEQNRLQRLWLTEAAEQLQDDTPEGYRAFCKLTIGVPILRAENEAFREQYDDYVKGLPYETKLSIMREPIDMPVTRMMTTRQKTQYLDAMWQHFASLGVRLTDPESLGRAA